MKIFCFKVSAAEPYVVGPYLSPHQHHPPRPTLIVGAEALTAAPKLPMVVWTGPLCCYETRRLNTSEPGGPFPDTDNIFSPGRQEAAPGSSVCEPRAGLGEWDWPWVCVLHPALVPVL